MRVAALFAEYDRNSDGVINLEELDSLLKALGPNTGVEAGLSCDSHPTERFFLLLVVWSQKKTS